MTNISKLKMDLLCKGIRINPSEPYFKEIVPTQYAEGGKSRAGVAGSGKSFLLENQEPCNIGVLQPFLQKSPYEFKIVDDQGWILKDDKKILRTTLREPKWHSTPLSEEIQLHGTDSLATALSNYCMYKKEGKGCKFCIIDVGDQVIFRNPLKIAQTVETIEKNPELRTSFNIEDKYNPKLDEDDLVSRRIVIKPQDINLNAGVFKDAVETYKKTITEIRKVSNLPLFIEIGSLKEDEMETLYSAGTDSISLNLEVFDQKYREKIIPGKAEKQLVTDYLNSMEQAVNIFGENQVTSWILIGLEPAEKTIEGIKNIAEAGAIPLPKPFRPLYGADLEKKYPPTLEDATRIYREWLEIIKECGLNPTKCKAGCARCNACFPLKELLKEGL